MYHLLYRGFYALDSLKAHLNVIRASNTFGREVLMMRMICSDEQDVAYEGVITGRNSVEKCSWWLLLEAGNIHRKEYATS